MNFRKLLICLPLVLALAGCSRDPKEASKKYVANGLKYFEKNKFKEASLMFRQALNKDRLNGEAYYRLGLTALRLGSYREAQQALHRAVELQPNNIDAMSRLADLYLAAYLGNPRHPQEFLSEVKTLSSNLLKKDPRSYDGNRLAGYLALAASDVKTAITHFRTAHDVKPYQTETVLALMQSLSRDNQFAEAEKLAREMIAKDKTAGPIYDSLYVEYIRQKRLPEAEATLKSKVENNPKVAGYRVQMARYYLGTRRLDEMKSILSQLASDTAFPNGALSTGDFYFQLRDFDSAIKYYNEGASRPGAQKPMYQKRILEALASSGKHTEAQKLVEELIKADPKDAEAVAIRAALSLSTGTRAGVQAAVADLQSVVSKMPRNPVVRFNLGRALMSRGEFDAAKVQLQEAVKLRPDYIPPKLALAQIHLRQGNLSVARQIANEILAVSPAHTGAKLMRAGATAAMGETKVARGELEAILKDQPTLLEAQFQLAAIDIREKRFKDAEQRFIKARQAAPSDARAVIGLAEAQMYQNQPAVALNTLQEEITKNPDNGRLRYALGNIATMSGNNDLALQQFDYLITKFPNTADLYMRKAEVQRRAGRVPQAIDAARKAREVEPKLAAAHLQLALLYEGVGNRAEARPIYDQILKLEPDNAIALNNLAYIMAESGTDLDQALTFAQRARQKMPNNPEIADTLGWIYIKKNLSDSAIQIFRELVAKYDRAPFRYHLAMALYQKGDKPQAKKELEAALRRQPDKEIETKIKELMGKLG
jgi:tetratricopeptide (TPR) repeat protein